MKFNGKLDKAEAVGFISIEGITFDVEVSAEESITFLKQILPIARELKEFGIFQTQKENDRLAEKLNETREQKREMERENRQTKSSAELEKDRLQAKVKELEEKLRNRELKVD